MVDTCKNVSTIYTIMIIKNISKQTIRMPDGTFIGPARECTIPDADGSIALSNQYKDKLCIIDFTKPKPVEETNKPSVSSNKTSGSSGSSGKKKWINDGTNNKFIGVHEPIPEGFRKGRVRKNG